MLVGLPDASGVHPFHVQKIDECAQDRLYRCVSYPHNPFGVKRFHFLMHLVIERFVNTVVYLFKLC